MSRILALLSAFLTAVASFGGAAIAATHVAVIVDNGAEAAAPGGSRARTIAQALERMNYTVTLREGVDAATLRQLAGALAASSREAEVALFFYAGPAVSADGRNMLIARGAANRASDGELVPVAEIEAAMAASKANVLMLDTGTLDQRVETMVRQRPDRSPMLASFEPRPGFLVASSAMPGRMPGAMPNVFSDALAGELAHRDFSWSTLAQNLRWQTFQRSRGAQVPMILSRLDAPVRVAALGTTTDTGPSPLPGRSLTPAERQGLITQIQTELKAHNCHAPEANGDAATATRGLVELQRHRKDAPRLDIASATADDYEAWLMWLRGTSDLICKPAAPQVSEPPVKGKRPAVAKPQREDPPQRAERPVQRRAERADPPQRREPPARRESSGGGGGGRSSGGGGGPRISVPSF